MTGLLVALVLGIVQASTPVPPAGQAVPPPIAPRYAVGPEDVLKVTVFNETELSRSYRVDVDGAITFPLIGIVPVEGRTASQIAEDLTRRLADGFLRNPQVSVEVEQYRSRTIFVLGEVKEPGMFSITGEVTLLEAITKAGSFTPAAGDEIRLSRLKSARSNVIPEPDDSASYDVLTVSRDGLLSGSQGQDIVMKNGDRVVVGEAKKFYIMGNVRNPGYYPVYRNMTIQQAIAVAGGLTERGSDRRIKVRRRDDKGVVKEIGLKRTDLVHADDTIQIGARIF
jgi:polysaccharide export outer membrane protein